ncbi:hypothetical protein L596_011300 [Steinernema carpocapsae]|uniref:MABP1/WDR62 second WD40 domain-containing protein n=1 Tax=Steinernema carpocapsae TaxID=34508 RepID=A0A4U5NUF1_STECR|nr:hypothetical protein L596_011300 [Steinernema carpocapsae]
MENSKLAKLEKVLGCTACLSSVSVDEKTGAVAYPAGSTVVLYNARTNTQAHLIGTTKSNITSLAFSKCGRYIATGEYGHEPKVRVWELYNREGQFCGQQVCELKEHKLGISCVRFSNDTKYVISVGNQHDKSVVVWDWRNRTKAAENRLTSQVNAMDVSENGQSFVTVGVRHVKFWYLPAPNDQTTLQGRSAILAEQRNNTFVDVCCAKENRTFAITQTKLLVEFHDKKLVNVYELKKNSPYSLALSDSELFIGFENGMIRALDLENLQQKYVFCNPHYLGADVVNAQSPSALLKSEHPDGSRYPHAYFILFHKKTSTMTAFYSDRSIYQWQVLGNGQITKVSSHLSHAGHIFDLQVVPSSSLIQASGTFVTSGSDETVRIWNIEKPDLSSREIFAGSNVLSQELKKIVYVGESNDSLIEPSEKTFGAVAGDTLDSRIGVRCVRVSPDGQHLATGTKDGKIAIFNFTNSEMTLIAEHDAHNSEVLCLQYSNPATKARFIFASGGRDRLVHLFDPLDNYDHLLTVDDHASSINSINFLLNTDGLDMYTCATDKLVVIRRLTESNNGIACVRVNQFVSQCSLNDMVLSPDGSLVAACHDRQIRTYNTHGKLTNTVKGTLCEDGVLTKLSLDPSGTFAAAVCSDRFVYLVNSSNGECAAVLSGFSEPVTALSFTNDCRRLIAVSYSGCIFIWRLSSMLTKKMSANLKRLNTSECSTVPDEPNERSTTPDSLIESGSESASVSGGKATLLSAGKDSARGATSGSEFGSLTSVHIAAGDEDDLDSGVGGAGKQQMQHHQFQMPQVVIDSNAVEDKRAFELKRVPADVVRRTNSGLLNQGSSNDLRAPGYTIISRTTNRCLRGRLRRRCRRPLACTPQAGRCRTSTASCSNLPQDRAENGTSKSRVQMKTAMRCLKVALFPLRRHKTAVPRRFYNHERKRDVPRAVVLQQQHSAKGPKQREFFHDNVVVPQCDPKPFGACGALHTEAARNGASSDHFSDPNHEFPGDCAKRLRSSDSRTRQPNQQIPQQRSTRAAFRFYSARGISTENDWIRELRVAPEFGYSQKTI